jgi:hypothetical protein
MIISPLISPHTDALLSDLGQFSFIIGLLPSHLPS